MDKIKRFLSKKGNALLIAMSSAIITTMSIFMFTVIINLSENNKERIAHLYNAYQMGIGVKAVIEGTSINLKRLTGNIEYMKDDIENSININLNHDSFVTLKQLTKLKIVTAKSDPTASKKAGKSIDYDLINSGVLIRYLNHNNGTITDDNTRVKNLQLYVNLAGTTNTESNAPYDEGDPFYYILMDTSQSNTNGYEPTIDLPLHKVGILSAIEGGPSHETSVILPQDNGE